MERLISLLGLVTMVGLAWIMSSHRRRFNLRVVAGGLMLQFALALVILKTVPGKYVFQKIGEFFARLLDFVDAGSSFVFGEGFAEHAFAFKVLPTIIFFSSLMAVLYHLGLIQRVVGMFAWLMRRTLRTSGAETLAAAANVFVGQTEAPLVIRPYIASMTQSEMMALMVGGFSTVAGGVLAAYVLLGIDAGHLVTASVISAPAALLIAKVMQPEIDQPKTLGRVQIQVPRTSVNLVEAASTGAADGLKLALNVAAMLIAFLALLAMLDATVGAVGRTAGYLLGYADWSDWNWSLTAGLGYAFAPLAWLMGIEAKDCLPAGRLLGERMVANEFVAYVHLGEWLAPDSEVQLSRRTEVILTYALCGFANFSSIGIQLGGIGGIAPERRTDLAKLGVRAMLGGTLAAFMTACVAGMIIDPPETPETQPAQEQGAILDQDASTTPGEARHVPDATRQQHRIARQAAIEQHARSCPRPLVPVSVGHDDVGPNLLGYRPRLADEPDEPLRNGAEPYSPVRRASSDRAQGTAWLRRSAALRRVVLTDPVVEIHFLGPQLADQDIERLADVLRSLSSLEVVCFVDSRVSDAGVDKLRKTLPRLSIDRRDLVFVPRRSMEVPLRRR